MLLVNLHFFHFVPIFTLLLIVRDSIEITTDNITSTENPEYTHSFNQRALNASESEAVHSNDTSIATNSTFSEAQEHVKTELGGSSVLRSKNDDANATVPNILHNVMNTTTALPAVRRDGENVTSRLLESPLTPTPTVNAEAIKGKALENLMQIFGITEAASRDDLPGPAPEFMIELYNTITDSYGVTRAKNPYDAHVVRSFSAKDNSNNEFLFFNISGLEETETVLEAELHIHRLQTPHEQLHPSLYLTPFYILSLYQVSDPNKLDVPDLHHLLGVHYVPALGSGWEVFNVKQSVLKWMNGQSNYGFLVVATSLGGDRVPISLSRRRERQDNKQPILVLFTRDSTLKTVEIPTKPKVTPSNSSTSNSSSTEEAVVPNSSLEIDRFHHALLYKDSIRHPNSVNRYRSRRSKNQTESSNDSDHSQNMTTCNRRDLFVSFEAIGWSSWIISPKGYNAFYCTGPCSFPLGLDVKPSNHATVQSIVHELKLAAGVDRPCCVPTALLPISLLYYDDPDNVVLKQYVDMVVEDCGCS